MDWTTATQVLTTTSSATVIGCSSNYILVLQNSALLYKLQRVFLRNPTSLSLWTNLCVSNSTANDMSNVSFIAANFMMATFIAKRTPRQITAARAGGAPLRDTHSANPFHLRATNRVQYSAYRLGKA